MFRKIILIAAIFSLSGCKGSNIEYKYPKIKEDRDMERMTSVITGDEEGLVFGGSSKKASMPVNVHLWRASMDTVSFMPLMSTDSTGGTIITDWYIDPKSPNERFKFTIMILSENLRVDALKVTMFKQIKQGENWVSAKPSTSMVNQMEDTILSKARDYKIKG
jgi:uncharacterized protein DUF3576